MSFVQEAVEQLHAVRFSSLQSASDCGTDGSLARLSLVLAKAGLRDLERSPRRLLGPGMDAETMIMCGPCLVSGHALRSRGVPGARVHRLTGSGV